MPLPHFLRCPSGSEMGEKELLPQYADDGRDDWPPTLERGGGRELKQPLSPGKAIQSMRRAVSESWSPEGERKQASTPSKQARRKRQKNKVRRT
uniref:Uncharacterized protein n=1 Tax=Mustela putorius furo TaxID=9669 RepID=M3XRE9_MUSPF